MPETDAFFIQKDSFILPEGEFQAAGGAIPLNLAGQFPGSDIFTVPSISDGPLGGSITGVSIPPDFPLPAGWQSIPARRLLPLLETVSPFEDSARPSAVDGIGPTGIGSAGRMLRALHIAQWRRDSQYCGSCGAKNTDTETELARRCPVCGRMEFPRIAPAVITIITNNEGKALLAHNKKFTPGVYSLIAGFVEAGESLEAAVVRETREEIGIEIYGIRYVSSQPWPFPNSLMTGFTAKYKSGSVIPDGIEIEDARWFGPEELPKLPAPGSISLHLINLWRDKILSNL